MDKIEANIRRLREIISNEGNTTHFLKKSQVAAK
jgi:hypothetical protein